MKNYPLRVLRKQR